MLWCIRYSASYPNPLPYSQACKSLVSLPVWVISVDNCGQVLVTLQARVVWHVKTEVLHQSFALNTSYIRAYAWSVYSCCHGILVQWHGMNSKYILKQSDACAPREEECLPKCTATQAHTTSLRTDLPGENITWKFIAYLEQHIPKHRCYDDGQFWKAPR